MIARRFSLRQKLVALAPLLLLAASVPGQVMLRCRIDGLLRTACCCPHGEERESAGPAVKAADCCDRETPRGEGPPAEPAIAASRDGAAAVAVAPAALFATDVALPPPARACALATGGRYGPAREGPPIVLAKHAFLI